MPNCSFYVLEYNKETGRIRRSTVAESKNVGRKSSIERDYWRANSSSLLKSGLSVLALRKDLARYYITELAGNLYLDDDMMTWYPPEQSGRKPKTFYTRTPPIPRSKRPKAVNRSILCPNCYHIFKKPKKDTKKKAQETT